MILRGIRGSRAAFHSTIRNRKEETPPTESIVITIGLLHAKYDPPPEIGIRRKIIPKELSASP